MLRWHLRDNIISQGSAHMKGKEGRGIEQREVRLWRTPGVPGQPKELRAEWQPLRICLTPLRLPLHEVSYFCPAECRPGTGLHAGLWLSPGCIGASQAAHTTSLPGQLGSRSPSLGSQLRAGISMPTTAGDIQKPS